MLRPAGDSEFENVLTLLRRGFPRRSAGFWENGLDRVVNFNRRNGQSTFGQLLIIRERPVGVMLTLTCDVETAKGDRYRLTNLSSWYVEPEHRLLAPVMLQKLVRDDGVVFTDLTPSDRVIPMLPMLGFRPLNAGLSAIALPVAALQRANGIQVRDFQASEPGLSPATLARMEINAAFGASAAILETAGVSCPVLFQLRTLRGVPVAQLVYSEDNSLLIDGIGAVARFLLKKGRLALIMDIPLNQRIPGAHFLKRGLKFAKGGCFDNRTDYAGSELLVIGL